VDSLTVTTLENIIYLGYKNDVSFLIDRQLCLVEQQSTWNPNAPLRGVLYFSRLYREFIAKNGMDLYGTKQLELPFPCYLIFYNGTAERPAREVLKLSSSFPTPTGKDMLPALECQALVLNINYGKNLELMEKCKPLMDYSLFISYIRDNLKKGYSVEDAMDLTIERCLKEGVLADLLVAHRREVVTMFLEEYDEELHHRTLRREGYEDGWHDGQKEGILEGNLEMLHKINLLQQKLMADDRMGDFSHAIQDIDFLNQLFQEYKIDS
jgi:hypothetical protein